MFDCVFDIKELSYFEYNDKSKIFLCLRCSEYALLAFFEVFFVSFFIFL